MGWESNFYNMLKSSIVWKLWTYQKQVIVFHREGISTNLSFEKNHVKYTDQQGTVVALLCQGNFVYKSTVCSEWHLWTTLLCLLIFKENMIAVSITYESDTVLLHWSCSEVVAMDGKSSKHQTETPDSRF